MRVRELVKTRATIAVYRSRAVRESARFSIREIAGPGGRVGLYRLRHGPGHVVLRHRSRDLEIFHELIVADAYRPPQAVERALAGVIEPRIVDLGANIGLFGVASLRRWPAAKLTAFEPDPDNLALLRRCVDLNQANNRWHVIEAFASAEAGHVLFRSGLESYSRQARPDEASTRHVISVPAVDVFDYLADADVVKLDIEGAEWDIIADSRLRRSGLRALVIEYHNRSDTDPHCYAERLLNGAGFSVQRVHRDDELGLGMLWAWRTT